MEKEVSGYFTSHTHLTPTHNEAGAILFIPTFFFL